jgi:uncharacterized membrane protein
MELIPLFQGLGHIAAFDNRRFWEENFRRRFMRHALELIHGPFMEHDDGGTVIFFGFFIIAALVLMDLLTEFFGRKNHPEQNTLLKILKEKYARHVIGADEYRERSMILEDEYWLDADDPEMMMLKERYAGCEMDSREYVKRREEISERRRISTCSLKERHA